MTKVHSVLEHVLGHWCDLGNIKVLVEYLFYKHGSRVPSKSPVSTDFSRQRTLSGFYWLG